MNQRWALMIAIDNYPKLLAPFQLKGCVNDQELLHQLITARFQFSKDNIDFLQNEKATRENILKGLDRLAGMNEFEGNSPLNQGDLVLVSYSGHGSRLKEPPGRTDERDGYDSTLVPTDSDRPTPHGQGGKNLDITDDELFLRFQRIRQHVGEEGHLLLYFDCCNSGAIQRDIETMREVPQDDRYEDVEREDGFGTRSLDGPSDKGRSGWFPGDKGYTLISGCTKEEKAREYRDPESGKTHGVLTYFFVKELESAAGTLTYRDIFQRAMSNVTGLFSSQHPQLEGEEHRHVFGLDKIDYDPFVRVEERLDERRVKLAAGFGQSATVGSRWTILGPNLADKTVLAEVTIRQVDLLSSEAESTESLPPEIAKLYRAEEIEHAWGDFRTAIAVEGEDTKALERMREKLRDSKLLNLVKKGPVEMIAVRLPPRDSVDPTVDFAPELEVVTEPTWVLVGQDRRLLPLPPHADSEENALADTLYNMETWARLLRFRRLAPTTQDVLGSTFKVKLLCFREDGQHEEFLRDTATGMITLEEGDEIVIQLYHDYPKALFYTGFSVGATGRISPIFYTQSGDALLPSIAIDFYDFDNNRGWPVSLPDTLLEVLPGALCAVKVLISTRHTDFTTYAQAGGRLVDSHPAVVLYDSVQRGARDIEVSTPVAARTLDEAWGVAQVDYYLKRKASL
ncbi:MAG: caspase family protein [Ardenticatenales bacterium]|nr:caspase family protein [Ardenticatenales bacterium]